MSWIETAKFENADFREVSVELTTPAELSIESTDPISGLYSAKVLTGTGGAAGRCRLDFVAPNIRFLEAKEKIRVNFWNGYVQPLRLSGHTLGYYVYVATVTIRDTYLRLNIGMKKTLSDGTPNPANWTPDPTSTNPLQIQVAHNFIPGQIYPLALEYKAHADGYAKVYVNDILKIDWYGDLSNSPDVDRTRFGVVLYQTGVEPAEFVFDDLEAKELIQTIIYTLNVNSTPITTNFTITT